MSGQRPEVPAPGSEVTVQAGQASAQGVTIPEPAEPSPASTDNQEEA
jgi:hypothetical protein